MYAPDIAKDALAKDAPDTGIPRELVHSTLHSTATTCVHIIAHQHSLRSGGGAACTWLQFWHDDKRAECENGIAEVVGLGAAACGAAKGQRGVCTPRLPRKRALQV